MSKGLFLLGTATLILNTVRPFGVNLSIPDALYLFALYVLILEGLGARQRVDDWMPFHPLWVPSLLVLVGGVLSSVAAVQPGVSVVITVKQWFVFSIWTSMGIVMARRGQVGNVVTALTTGALFTSSIAIWDFVFGARVGPAISGEPFLRWGRYSGTMGHPNELGYITAVVAPLILDRILGRATAGEGTPVASSVLWGAFGVLVLANILAGSVTGYLGLVSSFMVVIVGHIARAYLVSDLRPLVKVIGLSLIGLVLVSLAVVRAGIPEILTVRNALDRMMYITGPHRLSLAQEALAYIASGSGSVGHFHIHSQYSSSKLGSWRDYHICWGCLSLLENAGTSCSYNYGVYQGTKCPLCFGALSFRNRLVSHGHGPTKHLSSLYMVNLRSALWINLEGTRALAEARGGGRRPGPVSNGQSEVENANSLSYWQSGSLSHSSSSSNCGTERV